MMIGKNTAGNSGMRRSRSRRFFLCAVCLTAVLLLAGCISRSGRQEKLRDLEFIVLDQADVPRELGQMIEEEKAEPFRMTYADQGKLFIAEGYGAQLTTGYSVQVTELYETEDEIRIHTNLLGPEKGEEIKEITTFPCLVVQLEASDKNVIFE